MSFTCLSKFAIRVLPKYQFCTDTVGFSKNSKKKMSLKSSLLKQNGFQRTSLHYWLDQVFLAPFVLNKSQLKCAFTPDLDDEGEHAISLRCFMGCLKWNIQKLAFRFAETRICIIFLNSKVMWS